MPPLRGLVVFLLFVAFASAQTPVPRIFPGGVVNGASFMPQGAPGGGIAQGSIFSVFGGDLAVGEARANAFPIPTELDGVRVEVSTSDGRVWEAPILYADERQINAILPSDIPVGRVLVTVFRDGAASNPASVTVVRSSLGLFTFPLWGHRAAALEGTTDARGFSGPTVALGDTIELWGTGLGPVAASDAALPPFGDLPTGVRVLVGGQPAAIVYQGRSGCCAGVDQLNVRVPGGAPLGCFVPVVAEVNGALYSNFATIAIAEPGQPCWAGDPLSLSPETLAPTGRVELVRSVTTLSADLATASFYGPKAWSASADAAYLPPPGTCLADARVRQIQGDFSSSLDAGAEITLTTPAGALALVRDAAPAPTSYSFASETPFLGPGAYGVEGAGGSSFPAFSSNFDVEAPSTWANAGEIAPFFRVSGFGITWRREGSASGDVLLAGNGLLCRAAESSGLLTIPPPALSNLLSESPSLGFVDLSVFPMEFATDGPESGLISYRASSTATLQAGRPHLPSTPVRLPNGVEIQTELAITFGEKQRGLMFRPELPRDQGMLFVYDSLGSRRFWMLNTLVPLDIIFLDADQRIVFISADTPICTLEQSPACPSYGPLGPAQSVLELAAGEAQRQGLEIGSRLEW